MNVLFLDFDGVINNCTSDWAITLPITLNSGKISHLTYWMPECIVPFLELMKWCVLEDIKLIITSSWRINQTSEVFNNYFKTYFKFENECIPEVIGLTDVSCWGKRGMEIVEAVMDYKVNKYICVDDEISDIVSYVNRKNVIKIDSTTGLTMQDVEVIKDRWKSIEI